MTINFTPPPNKSLGNEVLTTALPTAPTSPPVANKLHLDLTAESAEYGPGLDGWAPVALHQQTLSGHQSQQAPLRTLIAEATCLSERQIIHDPRLLWLVRSLATETWTYLEALGHDVAELDTRITGVWASAAGPGENVPAHARPDADLCAVYYVDAPTNSGALRMISSTRGTHADYTPTDGNLIIFPARQRHQQLENQSDRAQLALTFDLVVSHRDAANPADRALPRALRVANRVPATTPLVLRSLRPQLDPLKSFNAVLADATHMEGLPPDPVIWRSFCQAVVMVADELERAGHSRQAAIGTPSVAWRHPYQRTYFATAPTDLQVYLRLDDADDTSVVEFEDGAPPTPLEAGRIVIVEGERSHRLLGKGVFMRIGVNIGATGAR